MRPPADAGRPLYAVSWPSVGGRAPRGKGDVDAAGQRAPLAVVPA